MVWVGVSAQSVGVEGGGGAFDISLKVVDPVRYGGLNHPGDDYSYDIFSQAAQSRTETRRSRSTRRPSSPKSY